MLECNVFVNKKRKARNKNLIRMNFEMFVGGIINKYGKDEQNLIDELHMNIAHVKHKPNKNKLFSLVTKFVSQNLRLKKQCSYVNVHEGHLLTYIVRS
jgi:hypothetical protein